MAQRTWFFAVPVMLLVSGLSGRAFWNPQWIGGADRRIMDTRGLNLEEKLGYHLYAPTWLPYKGHVGPLSVREGAHRVLEDFTDEQGRALCILAQERRSPERDAYHERIFVKAAEATAKVRGKNVYYVTGSNGERRLFWNEDRNAIILSSAVLSDAELLKVADRVR